MWRFIGWRGCTAEPRLLSPGLHSSRARLRSTLVNTSCIPCGPLKEGGLDTALNAIVYTLHDILIHCHRRHGLDVARGALFARLLKIPHLADEFS